MHRNDTQASGDSFEQDFRDMIALFVALPSKPKVYVVLPPPLYPPYPYTMNATVINELFPQLLRNISLVSQQSIENCTKTL
jgi:hypothetical protein